MAAREHTHGAVAVLSLAILCLGPAAAQAGGRGGSRAYHSVRSTGHAGAHHAARAHRASNLRHGSNRPAVISRHPRASRRSQRRGPPGHIHHHHGHHGSIHHTDIDHYVHYHSLYLGYPHYYGYSAADRAGDDPTRAFCRYPPPPTTVSMHARPREYRYGLGVRLSSQDLARGDAGDGTGPLMGAVLRFRSDRVEAEAEIGEEAGGVRGTRLGGTLYLNVARFGALSPFVLAGTGMSFVEQGSEMYLEGGGGLGWRVTPRFTISADVRWSTRRTLTEPTRGTVLRSTTGVVSPMPESRRAGLVSRITAILYF